MGMPMIGGKPGPAGVFLRENMGEKRRAEQKRLAEMQKAKQGPFMSHDEKDMTMMARQDSRRH